MWKVSLYYLHNWQLTAFGHGNLAVETLSKIFSTIQESANTVSANTFLSRDKCLECLPSPFTYSCQTICKTRDSFINWTYGKLSYIFSSAIFDSETVLGFGWRFQNSFVRCSPDMTSPFHSNLDSVIVPSEAFADSSRGKIVEARAMRTEPHTSG